MKTFLQTIGSMKLAVVLLVLAMILVYAGSWAQVDNGIYQVQKHYFHSWFSWIHFGTLLPRTPEGGFVIRGGVPFPGGYTLGSLLLINLLAAQLSRVAFTWRRAGIHIAHVGVLLLLAGEAWSSVATIESRMVIREGMAASHTEDFHRLELAFIDRTPSDHDQVVALAASQLRSGATIRDPRLPLQVRVEAWHANSELSGPMTGGHSPLATAGAGKGITLVPRASFGGTQGRSDIPSAYLTLLEGEQPLGVWLVSMHEPLDRPQEVKLASGRTFYLQLRPARYVKPYQIKLLDFSHDVYPGTQMARNFSSRVQIMDPQRGVNREELIWMNHPLRYRGEVFYQASYIGDDVTVLQVVQNPAAILPYIACTVGSIGLLIQFCIALVGFLEERPVASRAAPRPRIFSWRGYAAAGALAMLISGWLVYKVLPRQHDLAGAASLPILYEGRLQPLDSVARNSLRVINGREAVRLDDGRKLAPADWLMDVLARPETADTYSVFLIENPDLVTALSLDAQKKRFSYADLNAHRDTLQTLVEEAMNVPPGQRDLVQRQVVDLATRYNLYSSLRQWMTLLLVPPSSPGGQWSSLADAAAAGMQTQTMSPAASGMMQIIRSRREGSAATEADELLRQHALLAGMPQAHSGKAQFEAVFNRFEPFVTAMSLYVVAFILVIASWLVWPRPLLRSAVIVTALALLVHTAGLAARMYIQGRPPVTNLYSSAVFIGWFAIVLALGLELIYRNGIATLSASLCGFVTLIIAQHLSGSGDTLGALVAVLDSNFWLTTHVLAITCGYSAAFLAGVLGIAWLIAAATSRRFAGDAATSLYRAIYGVVCFAMIFSFVGTILGGIWADQSWGRFWGWDPKENGAVLIVLWLAVMLHARSGRMAGPRGFAVMALFGNIVTAWSWFGTNMLGVGLHSYGFMDKALGWLLVFVGVNLLLMLLAFAVRADPPTQAK